MSYILGGFHLAGTVTIQSGTHVGPYEILSAIGAIILKPAPQLGYSNPVY